MLKKILRWCLILLGVAVLLLGVAAYALQHYLETHKQQVLSDLAATAGLDVSFRDLDLRAWQTFPRISVSVDSLVVRDKRLPRSEPALLSLGTLSGELSLENLWNDTLRINHITLADGSIYVASDSNGRFNLGNLLDTTVTQEDTASVASILDPHFHWDGVRIALSNLDLTFRHDLKHKRMAGHLDSLRTIAELDAAGRLHFPAEIAAHVDGLGFNTRKGSYLENADLSGNLDVVRHDTAWVLSPTPLRIAGDTFPIGVSLSRRGEGVRIDVRKENVSYDRTLALLPHDLRERLGDYHVSGTFPMSAEIIDRPDDPEKTEIRLAFELTGQDVRLRQYPFRRAFTSGTLTNRLPPAEGGIPGSKKNLRIVLHETKVYQDGILITSPGGVVRGIESDIRLEAPLRATGRASTLSRRLGNRDFLFENGQFVLDTRLDCTLNSEEEMIQSSDGRLLLRDLAVRYAPTDTRFPFRYVEVDKTGQDIRFRLRSDELPTGLTFRMEGKIDNLLPLLLDRPGERMRTDVVLTAPRLSWRDFLTLFGDEGYFTGETVSDDSKQSMKQTMLGLRNTFRPTIAARFDTLAYYDILSLSDFSTGLHFDADTLVLEHTTFGWEGGDLQLDARLDFATAGRTPFRIDTRADHLDLQALRPTLDSFGLALPAGLDSLPSDLGIVFYHSGVINDSFGIQPGYNSGHLTFNDGAEHLFAGTLDYRPTPAGLSTQLHMAGDPRLVNRLFAAESFFFGSGRFRIHVDVAGMPADLGQLVEQSDLRLEIDSSQVVYRPAGVYVPVRKFSVRSENERVTYDLRLTSDSTRRSVALSGTLDRLTAFLYPELERTFRMSADVSASRLHASDLRDFIRPDAAADTIRTDTTGDLDLQTVLSTSGGIFNSFRPDLSLRIDTFQADELTTIYNLHSGLRLRDSTRLVLEPSGFQLNEGSVRFSGSYDLDRRIRSPFAASFVTEQLDLAELRTALAPFNLAALSDLGTINGLLDIDAEVAGKLHEGRQRVMMDSTQATVRVRLTDAELLNWPAVTEIGRKVKLKRRFRHLRFAPLELDLQMADGQLLIPPTEIQSTALQVFVEGTYDTLNGPDLLIALPLRNIGRGLLAVPPDTTGFARSGWKVYLVMERNKKGVSKMKFRLGRRKFYRQRGRLEELRELRRRERAIRRESRVQSRGAKAPTL